MIRFFFPHNKRRRRQLRAGSFVDVSFTLGDTCLWRRSSWGCVWLPRVSGTGSQWHSPPVAQTTAHLNLAHVTPAVGRAAPLLNKCPLLAPELFQAVLHMFLHSPFLCLPHHVLGDLVPSPMSQGENPALHRAFHHPLPGHRRGIHF